MPLQQIMKMWSGLLCCLSKPALAPRGPGSCIPFVLSLAQHWAQCPVFGKHSEILSHTCRSDRPMALRTKPLPAAETGTVYLPGWLSFDAARFCIDKASSCALSVYIFSVSSLFEPHKSKNAKVKGGKCTASWQT